MELVPTLLSIVLAVVLAGSGAMKLSHRPQVVAMYADVGVPERMLTPLGGVLLAAAVGFVVGIWWEPLGVVTSACVVLYFVLAVGQHVRMRQLANVAMPVLILLLAAANLVLRVD